MQQIASVKDLDNYLNRLKKNKNTTINFDNAINLLADNCNFIKYSHFKDISNKLSNNLEAKQVINWLEKYIKLQTIMEKNKSLLASRISIDDAILIVLPKLKNDLTFDEAKNLIELVKKHDFKFKYDNLLNIVKKMKETGNEEEEEEEEEEEDLTYFFKIAFEYNISMDWNLFVLIINKFSNFDFMKLVNFYFETFSNGFEKIGDKDGFFNKAKAVYDLLMKKIDFSGIINVVIDGAKIINIINKFFAMQDAAGNIKSLKKDRKKLEKNQIDDKEAEATMEKLDKIKKDIEKAIEEEAKIVNELVLEMSELISGVLKKFFDQHKNFNESDINIINKMIVSVLKKFIGGNDDSYNGFDFVNIFSFLYDGSEFFDEFKGKVGELSALALKLSEEDYKNDDIEGKAKDANELAQISIELLSGILKNFLAKNKALNEPNRNMLNKMIIVVLKKFIGGNDDSYNGFDLVSIFGFLYDGSEFFDEFKEKVGEFSALALKLPEEDYKKDDIEGKAKDANELAQKAVELLSGILKNFLAKNKALNEPNRNMLNKMIIVVLKKFIGGNDDSYNGFDLVSIFGFLYDGSEFFNEFKGKVGEILGLALKLSEKDYGKDIGIKTKDGKEFYQKIFELIVNVLDNFFVQHKDLSESDKNIFNEIFNKCNNLFKRFWFQSNLKIKVGTRCYDLIENCVRLELFTPLIKKISEINLKLTPLLMFFWISIVDNVENDDTFKDYFKENYAAEFDFTNGIELYQLLYLFKFPQLLNFNEKTLDNFLSSGINLCLLEGNNKKSDVLHGVSDVSSIKKDDKHYYCVGFFHEDNFPIYVSENSLKFSEVQPLLEKIICNKEQLNFWLPFFYFAIKDIDELIRFLNEKEIDISCLSSANKQSKPKLVFNNFYTPFLQKKRMKIQEERKRKEEEEREKQDKLLFKDIKPNIKLLRSKSQEFKSKKLISEYESNIKENKEEEENKKEEKKEEQKKKEKEEQTEREKQDKLLFKDIKPNIKLLRSKSQEFKSKKLISEYESNIKENKEEEENKKEEKKEEQDKQKNKNQEKPENTKTNDEEVNQKKRMILFGGFALFFLVLTLTISILTFGTGTIPMLALGSTLIYNSVFGALTAGLGVGFFTSIVLFLKNCVSCLRSKSEKSLEVLNKPENSLPNKSESELNEDVSGNQIRTSKSLINLSDISKQINEEKPQIAGENFKNIEADKI